MNSRSPEVESFRPFVPATDFEISKSFYEHIGFTVDRVFPNGSGGILTFGKSSFILVPFSVKEHSENYMMQLLVKDVDHWWRHVQAAKLPETFGVIAPKPPQIQPWGIVVSYFVDPSGVLWHVVPAATA